jgi:hypothetical protein
MSVGGPCLLLYHYISLYFCQQGKDLNLNLYTNKGLPIMFVFVLLTRIPELFIGKSLYAYSELEYDITGKISLEGYYTKRHMISTDHFYVWNKRCVNLNFSDDDLRRVANEHLDNVLNNEIIRQRQRHIEAKTFIPNRGMFSDLYYSLFPIWSPEIFNKTEDPQDFKAFEDFYLLAKQGERYPSYTLLGLSDENAPMKEIRAIFFGERVQALGQEEEHQASYAFLLHIANIITKYGIAEEGPTGEKAEKLRTMINGIPEEDLYHAQWLLSHNYVKLSVFNPPYTYTIAVEEAKKEVKENILWFFRENQVGQKGGGNYREIVGATMHYHPAIFGRENFSIPVHLSRQTIESVIGKI